jgi:hypothetical protein
MLSPANDIFSSDQQSHHAKQVKQSNTALLIQVEITSRSVLTQQTRSSTVSQYQNGPADKKDHHIDQGAKTVGPLQVSFVWPQSRRYLNLTPSNTPQPSDCH